MSDNEVKSNGASDIDVAKRAAARERAGFIASAEEVDFRLSALLRAYTGPAPDVDTLYKRACLLRDACDEFGEFVQRLIDSYESMGKGKN